MVIEIVGAKIHGHLDSQTLLLPGRGLADGGLQDPLPERSDKSSPLS